MNRRVARILVADTDPQSYAFIFGLCPGRFTLLVAGDATTTLEILRREAPDLVIADLKLPGLNGLELLEWVKALDADLPVLVVTGHAEVALATDAVRAGAQACLAKPFGVEELLHVVDEALAERQHRLRLKQVSPPKQANCDLARIMGPSDAVGRLVAAVSRVAPSNLNVVITGELGTGKEVVARAIHQSSRRTAGPFVRLDCGAIAEPLMEAELFGAEPTTGAGGTSCQHGKLELARRGTLFLDEVLDLPLAVQAKLRRTLREKSLYRMGGTKPVRTDARLIATTSQDMPTAVARGAFRADLFFRLNEFAIHVPSLRERSEDIPYLANRFLELAGCELNKTVRGFSQMALDTLLAYSWPGNVRELWTTIRRAVLLADKVVTEDHLALSPAPPSFTLPSGLH